MNLPEEQVKRLLGLAGDYLQSVLAERKLLEEQAAEQAAAGAQGGSSSNFDDERESDVLDRPFSPASLVKSWFHTLENGEIVWQGCVVGEVQAGIYIVELHNWRDGASAHQRVVTLKEMLESDGDVEWRFYDTADWMKLAGQRVPAFEEVARVEIQ